MGLIFPRIRSWSASPPSDSHATKLATILSPRTHRDSTANPGIPGRDALNSTLSDRAGKARYLPLLEDVVSICMYLHSTRKRRCRSATCRRRACAASAQSGLTCVSAMVNVWYEVMRTFSVHSAGPRSQTISSSEKYGLRQSTRSLPELANLPESTRTNSCFLPSRLFSFSSCPRHFSCTPWPADPPGTWSCSWRACFFICGARAISSS